jgi:hypothetical protein
MLNPGPKFGLNNVIGLLNFLNALRFMGAYTMILDSMRNGQDLILIDEFLTQPKRGSFLEVIVLLTLNSLNGDTAITLTSNNLWFFVFL